MEKFEMANGTNTEKRASIAYAAAQTTWREKWARRVRFRNPLLRETAAEFFSTCFLMIFVQSTVASMFFAGRQHDILLISVGQGLAVTFAIYVSGGVSGALLNPAVNVAFSMLGKMSWTKTLFFTVAQYMGAFTASVLVYVIHYDAIEKYDGGVRQTYGPNATAGIFSTFPGEHRSIAMAFVHEIFCTAILLIGVLAVVDEKNWKPEKGIIPFAIGALITLINLGLAYGEGMSMNPARDLAPRLFTLLTHGIEPLSFWNYGWFWIPVVGSHVGAIVGGLLYALFIEVHHPPPPMDEYSKAKI